MKRPVILDTKILLLLLSYLTFMTGCGGGGGSNGVFSLSPQATAKATVQMDNASLQLNGTSNVSAIYTDASGKVIPGLLVTFTTTLGSFDPAGGAAVTDANGTATVKLLAGNASGSGIITASATVNGVKVSKQTTFAVALPPIYLSAPAVNLSTLTAGGTTGITVKLYSDAALTIPYTDPVDVSFTSNFSLSGKASLLSPVRTVGGAATSTYTATGGVGMDTVTVSVGNVSVTTSVTINGTSAGSISFVSATPKNINLKGMGGVGGSETSTVVFKVLDTNGLPKAGQVVDFSLNTTVGGLSLVSPSASSNADGTVSTIVKAGIVATPVRVTATIHGSSPAISTQSDLLVVSTGVPSQSFMSLAVATHNPEASNIDGVKDVFTVFLADHFGNPVPDGTAVNFIAQAGQITPSCTTVNGTCSATWTSSGARTKDGRAAILAYAVGEESFTDINGNGVADSAACNSADLTIPAQCGEFVDMPQAWRDDAHTGGYLKDGSTLVVSPYALDSKKTTFPDFVGDTLIDFNGTGKVDRDGLFNGLLRPDGTTGPTTKHVFQNNVIVMSTGGATIGDLSAAKINAAPSSSTPAATAESFTVRDLNDVSDNPLPAGTTVSVAGDGVCLTASGSFIVPNTILSTKGLAFTVKNTCVADGSGVITVTVTSPSGITTIKQTTVTW